MITGPMLLVLFVLSIALILLAVVKFKLNPFIVLLIVGVVTAIAAGMPLAKVPGVLSGGFGSTLGGIGIIIGLGVVLGQLLAEANATEQIADSLLHKVGDKKAPLAINIAGYLISIPVFFDAAFVILAPLIKQLSRKTKQPYISYVTALAVGLIVTHALVIPTPGPVAVASSMGADFGMFILYSIIVSVPGALVGGYFFGKYLGKKSPAVAELTENEVAYEAKSGKRPSAFLSFFILLFPIVLILIGSIMSLVLSGSDSPMKSFFAFIGDKNIALLLGVLVAMGTLKKYIKRTGSEIFGSAIAAAGMIFMITGAGGAYGSVVKATGIGDYIVTIFQNQNMPMIILGFLLSQILRASTGSTTVALVTTASIIGPICAGMNISPILPGLAICSGGIGLSLPNDSGFWVVSKYSNLSAADTIKSWTIAGTVAGLTSLCCVLILSVFSGFLPGLK
jgi:GntP family gluconate:H+ symporter